MAEPTTTSTAVAQGMGAPTEPSSTKVGGTPASPSRGTLATLNGEIATLKQNHDDLVNQANALEQRQAALAQEYATLQSYHLVPRQMPDPKNPNGPPIPDPNHQNDIYVDADGKPVTTDVVGRLEAIPQEAADNAVQITRLRQQAADVQVQVVDATLKRGEVARSVAADEDPRTLDALDRAADKEKAQLAKDQSDQKVADAKAQWQAAYDAGFPAGDKAAQDAALQAAQTENSQVTAKYNAAQAAGAEIDNQIKAFTLKYAGQTAAAAATQATAAAGTAVAGQSSAESKAIADQQAAAGGIGTWTAAVQQYTADAQRALAAKYGADTAATQLTTEQTRAGEAVTRINQLREAIKKGALTKEAAGDAYFNMMYGGDQFQRNTQASKDALDLQQALITAGMAVRPDQQYIVGGEPGGVYQTAMADLGYSYTPQRLAPTSLPAWATAAQIDISPRQGLPQGSPFDASGNFNPAFQSPLQQPVAAGAPAWATAPAAQAAAAPAITDARGGRFRAAVAAQPAA
jgi:chemotaxis protein histidine kinase CheA